MDFLRTFALKLYCSILLEIFLKIRLLVYGIFNNNYRKSVRNIFLPCPDDLAKWHVLLPVLSGLKGEGGVAVEGGSASGL